MRRKNNQNLVHNVLTQFSRPVFILLCSYFLFPKITFTQLNLDLVNPIILDKAKGLDVGQIIDVIEDKNGFLWIGGHEGLQRFDGLNFKRYENRVDDEYSFKFSGIANLFYDEVENQILISGKDYKNGFCILDLETEQFNNHPFGDPLDSIFNQTEVNWVHKDKQGNYWFSIREKGLIKYDPHLQKIKSFYFNPDSAEKIINYSVANSFSTRTPDYYNDSLIWIAGPAGIVKFNLLSGQYKRYAIDANYGNNFGIRSIFHHENNLVYVGTWGEGMHAFDPILEKFTKCNVNANEISKGNIVKINAQSKNKIWVTTFWGLVLYDITSDTVEKYWLDDAQKDKDFRIRQFSKDGKRQFAWRKTDIFIYDNLRQQVRKIQSPETDLPFIVRRILEDKETGKLWIAVQGSMGIYRLDLQSEEWELFSPPKSFSEKNPIFYAWDILQTRDGEILALDDKSIFSVSMEKKTLIPWKFDKVTKSRSYRRFIEDREGNIWVGSKVNGLYRINPRKNSIRHFLGELMNENKSKPGAILDLNEDRNGNIWIRSAGYSVYVPDKDTIYNTPYFYPDLKKVIYVSSLLKDGNGDVWIGSGEGSIGITDANHPELGIVEYIDENSNIQSKSIDAFHLDQDNQMWIVSNGIEKLNEDRQSELYLDPSYMPSSYLTTISQLSNGSIALGLKKGIGIFNPKTIKNPNNGLQPYIHSFKIFDKQINVDSSLLRGNDIFLDAKTQFFSFEISAKNPSYSGEVEFSYQLDGIDPGWVNPGSRNYISYANLNAGTYDFSLKARKNGGMWNHNFYKIKIHIDSPWYKKWWAYTILILAITSLLYYVYHLILSKRLKEEEADRLKEVDRFKTNFYSNITHEFRTPITVILGMADSLKSTNEEFANNKEIELIKGNGERLLRLVNEILGLAKAEKGKLTSNLIQGDIISFIKYIGESFQFSASQSKISLTIYSEIEHLEMDFDADKVASIVSNLVNNAIKFTPEFGEIVLHINRVVSNKGDILILKVKDNGTGLSEENKTHVFNKYYQVNNSLNQNQEHGSLYNNILNNNADASGIGLSLTKEYVELLGGEISVESQLGIGSVFIVKLPITNSAPFSSNSPISLKHETLTIKEKREESDLVDESEFPLVLIVEDDPGVAHYLKKCLKGQYSIRHAKNGIEGIEMALKLIPDVVISDIMMPGKSGLELCDFLKTEELTDHIPIILLTAKATMQDRLVGLAHGADAYLSKPFLKEELYTRLEQLINTRKRILKKVEKSSTYNFVNFNSDSTKAKFIDKAIKIVLENLSDHTLGSAQLAHKLQLSESQVYRKLKASTNKSTAVFIRSIRLQKSRELIKSTELSISEIAYDVGFNDPSWFSRVFKEEFGMSPTSLRI